MKPLVAVVGSANLDIVLSVSDRPAAGETVMGTGYAESPGGKGFNQAIAAARVAPTIFIGCVGHNSAGRRIAAKLASAGISTEYLARSEVPTGRAYIALTLGEVGKTASSSFRWQTLSLSHRP